MLSSCGPKTVLSTHSGTPMSITVSCIIRHTSAATVGLLLSTPNTGRPSEM